MIWWKMSKSHNREKNSAKTLFLVGFWSSANFGDKNGSSIREDLFFGLQLISETKTTLHFAKTFFFVLSSTSFEDKNGSSISEDFFLVFN